MRRMCSRAFRVASRRFCCTAQMNIVKPSNVQTVVGGTAKHRKFERMKLADTFGTLRSFEGRLSSIRITSQPMQKDNVFDAYDGEEEEEEEEEIGWTSNFLRAKFKADSRKLPIITQPVAFGRKHRKKVRKKKEAEEEYERVYGVDRSTAKVIIDCARKEYNHYEGMRYPPGEIQLVSEYWVKNKYKNDWFSINPVTRKNPSFNRDEAFSWDENTDLLNQAIIENARKLGFRVPTVIQRRVFRVFKSDAHILIAAETGSGKTVAYAAPLLSALMQTTDDHKKGIVLVPTHALRMQTSQMISKLAEGTGMKIMGGAEGWRNERLSNDEDWNILVSTPSLFSGYLASINPVCVVLDEADMLLDDSFLEDITRLLSHLKIRHSAVDKDATDGARLIFSSATYPDALQKIAESIVADEHLRCVRTENLHRLLPHVKQTFIRIREVDKLEKLKELIEKGLSFPSGQTLIFCKDSKNVKLVSASLTEVSVKHAVLCGGRRVESVMDDMASGTIRVIVATDVASRGLDLPELRHIINYDFPRQLSDYVHRCGRVGRVGSLHKCLMTSFVRRAWEVKHVNTVELAARRGHALEDIELNDPARLRGLQRDLF